MREPRTHSEGLAGVGLDRSAPMAEQGSVRALSLLLSLCLSQFHHLPKEGTVEPLIQWFFRMFYSGNLLKSRGSLPQENTHDTNTHFCSDTGDS